jgi:hypothetical protein
MTPIPEDMPETVQQSTREDSPLPHPRNPTPPPSPIRRPSKLLKLPWGDSAALSQLNEQLKSKLKALLLEKAWEKHRQKKATEKLEREAKKLKR